MEEKSLPGVLLVESDRELAKEVIDGLNGKARIFWHPKLNNPDGIISRNGIDLIVLGDKETRHIISSAQRNKFRGVIIANTGHKKSNKALLDAGAHFSVAEKDFSSRIIRSYI